ncbi:MAG: hypothetical protein K0Q87_4071, partial [Neobacillus sp.]|nr:hypothetical protein [Neobacillus sp.]
MICVEGTKDSSKMLAHFRRAVIIQGSIFNVLREYGAGETPQALQRRGGSLATPAESEVARDRQRPPV